MPSLQSKLVAWWFAGLSISHLLLSWTLVSVLPTFEARTAVISVSIAPWWLLENLGFPVTNYGWLTLPNLLGWLWCLLVWLGFYFVAARIIVHLTHALRATVK